MSKSENDVDPLANESPKSSAKHSEIKSKVLQSMERLRNGGEKQDSPLKKCSKQQSKQLGRTEKEVGITEYIDSSEKFTGITKHRWGDFIVHEIDLAGNVVFLTDTCVPMKKEPTQEELSKPEWFPEDIWEKIVELNGLKKSGDAVNVPASQLTKEQRTQYHCTIKTCFPTMITNTSEDGGEKVISVRKANSAPDKKNTFWKHKPWPQDRPKFLHFCLFKENLDTFVALSNLSMDLKLKSNKFSFAGTKDARAKTTQLVSVKQITAEKVHEAARKFPKMTVGNFTYKDSELKLGDLKGNQFDLVLRYVQGSDDIIARRMASFESQGFINYYGLQRFGTTSTATHRVGRAILRGEWRTAVDLLLSGREHETVGSMPQAHRAWREDRDPRRASSFLSGRQQRTTIEGRVLHSLCTLRATAYQEAIDRLPAGTRQLYVHAYQSYVWNRVVSRRVKNHGLKLRAGDLVLAGNEPAAMDEPPTDEAAATVEPTADDEPACADEPATDGPAATDGESSAAEPKVGREPFLPRLPEVRVLTEADLADYSIDDLVLPLPGWAVRYPDNDTAGWYKELLAADSIDLSRERCDAMPQFSVAGAYRRLLARPTNISWRMMRYADPGVDLIASDVDRLRGREPPADVADGPFRALVMTFSLPSSCYATMALREITGTDSGLAAQMALNEDYNAEIQRHRPAVTAAGGRAVGTERGQEGGSGAGKRADGGAATTDPDKERGEKRPLDGDSEKDGKRQKPDDA